MIVVVIIGILAAIAIPNYVSMTTRARESGVKANTHSCQLAVEEDAVKNAGIYPAAIVAAMFPGGVMPHNPFTGNPVVIGPLGGAIEGDCNYGLAGNVYTIEGVGRGGALVLTLSNN
jgi:type II secretory pathway pseudopilin PulG